MSLAKLLDAGLRRRGRGAASDLAAAVGVSTATVSRWRAGRDLPGPEYWPAIESFFDVEPGTVAGALEPDNRLVDDAAIAAALVAVAAALDRIADVLDRVLGPPG